MNKLINMKKFISLFVIAAVMSACSSDDGPSTSDSLFLPETVMFNDTETAKSAEIEYDNNRRILNIQYILPHTNYDYTLEYNNDHTLAAVNMDGLYFQIEYTNGRMSRWVSDNIEFPITYNYNSYFIEDFEIELNSSGDIVTYAEFYNYTYTSGEGVFTDVNMDESVKVFLAYFLSDFAAGFSGQQLQSINNANVNTTRNEHRMVSRYAVTLDGLPVTHNYYYMAVSP